MGMVSLFDSVCPHCLKENAALYGEADVKLLARQLIAVAFVCRSCNSVTIGEIGDVPNDIGYAGYVQYCKMNDVDMPFVRVDHKLRYGTLKKLYPSPVMPKAPDHTPVNIAKYYIEAVDNLFRKRHETTIMLCRKTLDLATKILNKEALKRDTLHNRIELLHFNKIITTDLYDWAKIIKDDGNNSTHSDHEYSEKEAEEILAFTEAFLLYIFTLPAKVKKYHHPEENFN